MAEKLRSFAALDWRITRRSLVHPHTKDFGVGVQIPACRQAGNPRYSYEDGTYATARERKCQSELDPERDR